MHNTPVPLADHRITRSVEQALAASPSGMPLMHLASAATLRESAAGRTPPSLSDVIARIGAMMAQGRIDERDGRIVMVTSPLFQRAA